MTPSQRAALEQKRDVSATSKPRCDARGTSRDIPRDYQRIADEGSLGAGNHRPDGQEGVVARQFGFPNVAALEVGQSCVVEARVSEVKRKCAQYGARNGKRLAVSRWMDNALIAKVSRLPVTDTELPGVG